MVGSSGDYWFFDSYVKTRIKAETWIIMLIKNEFVKVDEKYASDPPMSKIFYTHIRTSAFRFTIYGVLFRSSPAATLALRQL